MTSPFAGRMTEYYMKNDLVGAMTEEIKLPNKIRPGTISDENARKLA